MPGLAAESLVSGLFDWVGAQDFFQRAAEALDRYLAIGNIQLDLMDRTTGTVGKPHFSRPIDPDRLAEYEATYQQTSPRILKTLLVPGVLWPDWKLIDPIAFDRTEFASWLDRKDVDNRWCVDCTLPVEGTVALQVASVRGRAAGPYEDEGLKPFAAILPMLRRATDLHLRFTAAAEKELAFARALAVRSEAYLFLKASGRVVSLNEAAERFVRQGLGITISGGHVKAAHPADQAAFETALETARVAQLRGDLDTKLIVPLQRGQGGGRVRAKLVPLGLGRAPCGMPAQADIVLFLDDLAKAPASCHEPLIKLGLTKAEAALAVELLNGEPLKAAAEKRGVAHETARTQLKSIMHKLEVSRQTDLLRVLSRLLT